jgi:hypothetical protein
MMPVDVLKYSASFGRLLNVSDDDDEGNFDCVIEESLVAACSLLLLTRFRLL